MKYNNIYKARFIDRPNRFIAHVEVNGKIEKVHVKNTGRCKEILKKDSLVYIEEASNPNRKTRYSLISTYKGDMLINIDSQVPNKVVYEALKENKIPDLMDLDYLKPEVTYKNSRFDLYYEKDGRKGFIEIKGVTLEENGLALFPDAPTSRGSKHIHELIDSKKEGYESYLFFLVQINDIKFFSPHQERDPKFFSALKSAQQNSLGILAYNSKVEKNSIVLDKKIEVLL